MSQQESPVKESFQVDALSSEWVEFRAHACNAHRPAEEAPIFPCYVALYADTAGSMARHRMSPRQARLLAEALLQAADVAEQMPVHEGWRTPEGGG